MKKRVLVTCSAKGGVPYYWFSAYDQTLRMQHAEYDFEFLMESGNSAINISRNIAAQSAIEQGYWKLVQIDKDQFWNPTQLVALVSREEDIVAAPYVKKKSGPVSWLIVKTPGAEVREDGMLQCDFVGTGMLSTSVAALQHMVDFFPERRFDYEDESGATKSMTELFPIGLVGPNTPEGKLARIALAGTFQEVQDILHGTEVGTGASGARMLGEDYGFGHLARKSGLKLWCDTRQIVGHVGDVVYPVTPEALNSPASIPTHSLCLDSY